MLNTAAAAAWLRRQEEGEEQPQNQDQPPPPLLQPINYDRAIVAEAKIFFNRLNDHLQFPDSPGISANASNRRNRQLQQRQQQQQQIAANVNTATNRPSGAARPVRELTVPQTLRDAVDPATIDIHALGADPVDTITATHIGLFYQPLGKTLDEKFPNFRDFVNQVGTEHDDRNRLLDVLMCHTRLLAVDRHNADATLERILEVIDDLTRIWRNIGALHTRFASTLQRLTGLVQAATTREPRVPTNTTAPHDVEDGVLDASPGGVDDDAAGGEGNQQNTAITAAGNAEQDVVEGDGAPTPLGADQQNEAQMTQQRAKNRVVCLKGRGYMGETVRMLRIDVCVPNSIALANIKNQDKRQKRKRGKAQVTGGEGTIAMAESSSVVATEAAAEETADAVPAFLSLGTYFLKTDLLTICGMKFDKSDKAYKDWKNYVSVYPCFFLHYNN